MRIPRIYTDQALNPDTEITLEESSSRHLCAVLRLQAGDALTLFNGDGCSYQASIRQPDKKKASVAIGECSTQDPRSPLSIHLGIALSKGDRFEWVLQKATELGAARITPLYTQRVDVKLNRERTEKKQRHWQQIIASACEQCGRNSLPYLDSPAQLPDWLNNVQADQKWVLSPAHHDDFNTASTPASAALLIGPEGGLDDSEVELALRSGFKALQLGPRVLRTETAPIAAISILQYRWGDLG
ncbi:16S rRNA (uracil(1498)-N(3))-methyltransferase [Litorivivens sp.]|uniref:16S rRNA (uracil(1498)-N(3))-methyltransferase n=1 Tax=Litorivivens sp. TaxID=2020868 RepID=UPI00356A1954